MAKFFEGRHSVCQAFLPSPLSYPCSLWIHYSPCSVFLSIRSKITFSASQLKVVLDNAKKSLKIVPCSSIFRSRNNLLNLSITYHPINQELHPVQTHGKPKRKWVCNCRNETETCLHNWLFARAVWLWHWTTQRKSPTEQLFPLRILVLSTKCRSLLINGSLWVEWHWNLINRLQIYLACFIYKNNTGTDQRTLHVDNRIKNWLIIPLFRILP